MVTASCSRAALEAWLVQAGELLLQVNGARGDPEGPAPEAEEEATRPARTTSLPQAAGPRIGPVGLASSSP